jgi:hypothetical protein
VQEIFIRRGKEEGEAAAETDFFCSGLPEKMGPYHRGISGESGKREGWIGG